MAAHVLRSTPPPNLDNPDGSINHDLPNSSGQMETSPRHLMRGFFLSAPRHSPPAVPSFSAAQPQVSNTSSRHVPYQPDITGQLAPPGMKPRVTATLWEDEGSLCFQVEAKGVCVARREDNHMINGTKLLNVAGMTRGRRDGILKSEKVRHVVKIGPMHLKGVWIPFERALEFANKEKITDMLYPLFVHNIGSLLYHPTNQSRTSKVMAERSKVEQQPPTMTSSSSGLSTPQPSLASKHRGYASLDRTNTFPTPPASGSSVISGVGKSDEFGWQSGGPNGSQITKPLPSEAGLSNSDSTYGSAESSVFSNVSVVSDDRAEPPFTFRQRVLARIAFSMAPKPPRAITVLPLRGSSPGFSRFNHGGTYSSSIDGAYIDADKDSKNLFPVLRHSSASTGNSIDRDDRSRELPEFTSIPIGSPVRGRTEKTGTGATRRSLRIEDSNVHTPHGYDTSVFRTSDPHQGHEFDAVPLKVLSRPQDSMPASALLAGVGDWKSSLTPPRNQSLESPSTASMSTNTASTVSDDEVPALLTASERKQVLLNRLMAHFHAMFSSCQSPSTSVRTRGSRANSSENNNNSPGNGSSQGTRQTTCPLPTSGSTQTNTRKRGAGDDGDDDQGSLKKKARLEDNHDDELKQKFACPFFKRNPRGYTGWRSCPGPGWVSVHRVKEHVYRNHALPVICPRCQEAFSSENLRNEHLKSDTQCPVLPSKELEGIDSMQKELLRCRKKKHKDITEAGKWHDMYLIIFPSTDPLSVPTPYYDYVPGINPASTDSSGDELTRYEQFLRRELPNRVRQQLEVRIEERFNPLEETLRTELVEIVRDMQLQLFEIYKSSRTSDSGSAVHDAGATDAANSPPQPAALPSLEEELQPFWAPAYIDDLAQLGDFDGLLWNFSGVQAGSNQTDSGYYSLPLDTEEQRKKIEGSF